MRIPGRITLFGEAFGGLIEQATMSVPTRQALRTEADAIGWTGHSTYDPAFDQVGRILSERGYIREPKTPICGDLPLEFGLASSTALAIAHLNRWTGPEIVEAIAHTDRNTNGFRPSGADFAAVTAREPGVFGRGTWTPLPATLPIRSHLVLPTKDRKVDKLTATRRMVSAKNVFEPLIRTLVKTLERSADLDLDALRAYAQHLLDIGVYSAAQRSIVQPLLARGIVAKGVGAMYDRAVLVLADPSVWDGDPLGEIVPQSG